MFRKTKGTDKPLRFAIMCDSLVFEHWQEQCIEMLQLEGAELVLVVENGASPAARRHEFFRKLLKPECLLFRAWRKLSKKTRLHRRVNLGAQLSSIPRIVSEPHVVKQRRVLKAADVEAIRDYNLDFVLLFGFGIISGAILDVPRFGIWSFHHGDELKYRGSPPCFYELVTDEPMTGSVLQRVTERLDAGVILKKGYIRTITHSYWLNVERVLDLTVPWPAAVCRDILADNADYFAAPPSETNARIYRDPDNWQMIAFFWKLLIISFKKAVDSGFFRQIWNVGVVEKKIDELLETPEIGDVRWMAERGASASLADPFGVTVGDDRIIMVENYDFATLKGSIRRVDLHGNHIAPGVATPGHASYPYLVSDGNELYCVPETHMDNSLGLYRFDQESNSWQHELAVLTGAAFVDATIVRHNDRWWLFCTDQEYFPNACLFCFYADDLKGPWHPHSGNPVKIDSSSVRPGGTPFIRDGVLYRPAQDCSSNYGQRIVINRVDELTEKRFSETVVAVLDPIKPYDDGLHTISAFGDMTLIDGRRKVFYPFAWADRVRLLVKKKTLSEGAF